MSANDFWLWQGAHDRSFITAVFLRGWVDVHPWASLSCAICFGILSERLFSQLTSSALWRKAGANFITKAGRRATNIEIAPLAILVTDGVGEEKLGMITAFWGTDQAKVETSDPFSTLVQWNSPKPCVVVVKVFTNSPHLLWGSFGSPYLDITALSMATLTAQLHLHRLLPYSPLRSFSCKRKREMG